MILAETVFVRGAPVGVIRQDSNTNQVDFSPTDGKSLIQDRNWPSVDELKLAVIAEVLGLVEYAFELLIFAAKRETDDAFQRKVEEVTKRCEAKYRARLQQEHARSFFLPAAVALQRHLPDGLWRSIVRPAGRTVMKAFSGGK